MTKCKGKATSRVDSLGRERVYDSQLLCFEFKDFRVVIVINKFSKGKSSIKSIDNPSNQIIHPSNTVTVAAEGRDAHQLHAHIRFVTLTAFSLRLLTSITVATLARKLSARPLSLLALCAPRQLRQNAYRLGFTSAGKLVFESLSLWFAHLVEV